MSSASLPSDLSAWPKDPYRLLGVERQADLGTLKRAYTKLLKQYKPEQFPAEYQRLREAYEQVKNWAPSSSPDVPFPPSPLKIENMVELPTWIPHVETFDRPPEDHPQPERASSAPASPETSPHSRPPRPPPLPLPPIKTPWELAQELEFRQAYEQLLRLANTQASAEDYAQLYWLLMHDRTLDPQRTPTEWLVIGLQRLGLVHPLLQLYQRDWERNPDEACSPVISQLLLSNAPYQRVLELCRARWDFLAGDPAQAAFVQQDLTNLKQRLIDHSEVDWCQLVIEGVAHLTWQNEVANSDWVKTWQSELDLMSHLHLKFDDDLAQLDFAKLVVQQIIHSPALVNLKRLQWLLTPKAMQPGHHRTANYRRMSAEIADQPLHWLNDLANFQQFSPRAMGYLDVTVERLMHEEMDSDFWESAPPDEMATTFLQFYHIQKSQYKLLGLENYLVFCLGSNYSPGALKEALEAYTTLESVLDLSPLGSSALNVVYLACRAYWF